MPPKLTQLQELNLICLHPTLIMLMLQIKTKLKKTSLFIEEKEGRALKYDQLWEDLNHPSTIKKMLRLFETTSGEMVYFEIKSFKSNLTKHRYVWDCYIWFFKCNLSRLRVRLVIKITKSWKVSIYDLNDWNYFKKSYTSFFLFKLLLIK